MRRTRRVTFWIDPNLYMKFSRKLADINAAQTPGRARLTISSIIEERLEKVL